MIPKLHAAQTRAVSPRKPGITDNRRRHGPDSALRVRLRTGRLGGRPESHLFPALGAESRQRTITVSDAPGKDKLLNLLTARDIEAQAAPVKFVGFIDMLGFSDLVKAHPSSVILETGNDFDFVSTSMSKSSERFGRFHRILDHVAMNQVDASRPERMMIFSDCAFAIYENVLQAATSLASSMRLFAESSVPVRTCLAKGTCHSERFSIESFNSFHLTRSMFYGSGIVLAVEGEKKAGKGCRAFLSTSLGDDAMDVLRRHHHIMPLAPPNEHAAFELNYLEPTESTQSDVAMWSSLVHLRQELREPVGPGVLEQYEASFDAINRMRVQFGRPRFSLDLKAPA